MADTSADTTAMSGTPFEFMTLAQPEGDIPEVEPLGTRAQIDAAGEDDLVAKFEEYAAAAPVLVAHHDYQKERFDELYDDYIKIFTGLETLESIHNTTEAIAPGFDLLEEFELVDLPPKLAKAGAVVGKITLYAGGLAALGGLAKAGYQSRKASKLLTASRGKPIGAAQRSSVITGAKRASRMKVLGVIGAGLAVGSSVVGIIAAIENNKRRLAFLRDSVESYQNWYAATRQSEADMSGGSDEMQAAITDLMELLGYDTTQALIDYLGDSVQVAGEIQGILRTATRMLCATPPLAPAQVALYTGLPPATVARRKRVIDENPGLCASVG